MTNGSEQQSPAQALIPFTGYYTLDAATGSFVMVDTHFTWEAGGVTGAPSLEYFATVTLSSDGQTSAEYTPGENCSFDGSRLVITDPAGGTIADLTFALDGGMGSLSGTVGGAPVSGTTPFGPVQLSIWAGTYYRQGKPIEDVSPIEYPWTAALEIGADGTVSFAEEGGSLEPVSSYWYDYGMFVVGMMLSSEAEPSLFEMGTASGWGRVAGNATDGSMLVSLRLNEPAPHL